MSASGLARLLWEDPISHEQREFVLRANAVVSIGRSEANVICIPERHMSRQHAVVRYVDGVFKIADAGSASGFFVNDCRIVDELPLAHGDIIRFYVLVMKFETIDTD